jgi:outer membrane protein assembly factor BamB
MASASTGVPSSQKPLRLWPGVAIAIAVLFAKFVLPLVAPEFETYAVLGGVGGALLILLWWLFFSRAPWVERIGAIVLMALAIVATLPFVHQSIRGGMMGMMLPISAMPILTLGLVAWAVGTRELATGPRRIVLILIVLLGTGAWTLLRTDGITGSGMSQLAWRWTATREEELLARAIDEPAIPTPPPAAPPEPFAPKAEEAPAAVPLPLPAPAETESEAPVVAVRPAWPGFRGPDRDSVVHGVRINTDWSSAPPVEIWRRPVGPGWSSFAVAGDFIYTQEQRGEDEIVACYRLSTGEPVWRHRDPARFWESNGGAGPRATPTLNNGRVYTFGATGILNALNAATGAVIWSRDVAAETKTEVPGWGFSSSPLIVDDVVIVAADATLAAFDVATGRPRWMGPTHVGSYSSPHLITIDGVMQVVLLGGAGATSVSPSDGKVLWERNKRGTSIVQPAVLDGGELLVDNAGDSTGGMGLSRLAIMHGPGGWTLEERWSSAGLKPYFNDFVVHNGHAFGFDGSILASINLEDGTRNWKGGRYGSGQMILLADQDLLLVISEEGDLALVEAAPGQYREVAKFKAIDGKTWNHPVLVGDVLLVRNGEEMAAFRLPR